MTGIFDSGIGGKNTLLEFRKLSPNTDICFFQDRKNSPYGTKTKAELTALVKEDIRILISHGADRVLMACCTASTLYDSLPDELRKVSVPVIPPTANEAARVTKNGIIGVIATTYTAKSSAFESELYARKNVKEVITRPAQELVTLTECGEADGNIKKHTATYLLSLLSPFTELKIDTLILGCTHFHSLEKTVSGMLPGVRVISSAREGAREMSRQTENKGKGETVYIV